MPSRRSWSFHRSPGLHPGREPGSWAKHKLLSSKWGSRSKLGPFFGHRKGLLYKLLGDTQELPRPLPPVILHIFHAWKCPSQWLLFRSLVWTCSVPFFCVGIICVLFLNITCYIKRARVMLTQTSQMKVPRAGETVSKVKTGSHTQVLGPGSLSPPLTPFSTVCRCPKALWLHLCLYRFLCWDILCPQKSPQGCAPPSPPALSSPTPGLSGVILLLCPFYWTVGYT